jgi:hypothetical protein
MPTLKAICGAECGLAATGTASGGVEHWAEASGSVSVVTSGPSKMRSDRAYRFNPTAGTATLLHTFRTAVGSPATVVGRCYLYFATLPDVDHAPISLNSGAGKFGRLFFESTDNTLYCDANGTRPGSGFTVTTGVWYRIDLKVVFNTTITVDAQINGTTLTQATAAGASETGTSVRFGNSGGTPTYDYYIDDIAISGTSGDYPLGPGTTVGLYPSGDGAHSYSATTDFLDGGDAQAALAASGSEVDTWLSLRSKADGGLSASVDTANYVTNATGGTTEYLRWNFEDLPTGVASVNGVASVSTHHAQSATANAQSMKIIDVSAVAPEMSVLGTFSGGPPANTAATGVDLSATTIHVVYHCAAVGETTGAWTVANVNDLGVHWSSTDVAPDAYIDGICLEVDVPQQDVYPTGPTVSITPGTATVEAEAGGDQAVSPTGPTVTVTAGTPTVAVDQPLSPTAPTVSITAGTPALALSIAPTGPTVTITAGTASVIPDQPIAPTAPTVTITAGTPELAQTITLTGPTVSITAGTASVNADGGLTLTGPTVTVTAGTPTVTPGAVDITPTGPTVSITTGTPSLAMAIAPSAPTVTITAGTPTVTPGDVAITPTAPTVTVTTGTPALAFALDLTGATVTVTAGTALVSSDSDQPIELEGVTVTVTAGTVFVTPADPNPVTFTIRTFGHTAEIKDRHHTVTARTDSGVTVKEH